MPDTNDLAAALTGSQEKESHVGISTTLPEHNITSPQILSKESDIVHKLDWMMLKLQSLTAHSFNLIMLGQSLKNVQGDVSDWCQDLMIDNRKDCRERGQEPPPPPSSKEKEEKDKFCQAVHHDLFLLQFQQQTSNLVKNDPRSISHASHKQDFIIVEKSFVDAVKKSKPMEAYEVEGRRTFL